MQFSALMLKFLLGCTVVEPRVSVIVSIGSADSITGYAPGVV